MLNIDDCADRVVGWFEDDRHHDSNFSIGVIRSIRSRAKAQEEQGVLSVEPQEELDSEKRAKKVRFASFVSVRAIEATGKSRRTPPRGSATSKMAKQLGISGGIRHLEIGEQGIDNIGIVPKFGKCECGSNGLMFRGDGHRWGDIEDDTICASCIAKWNGGQSGDGREQLHRAAPHAADQEHLPDRDLAPLSRCDCHLSRESVSCMSLALDIDMTRAGSGRGARLSGGHQNRKGPTCTNRISGQRRASSFCGNSDSPDPSMACIVDASLCSPRRRSVRTSHDLGRRINYALMHAQCTMTQCTCMNTHPSMSACQSGAHTDAHGRSAVLLPSGSSRFW